MRHEPVVPKVPIETGEAPVQEDIVNLNDSQQSLLTEPPLTAAENETDIASVIIVEDHGAGDDELTSNSLGSECLSKPHDDDTMTRKDDTDRPSEDSKQRNQKPL